jgi:hypothetical protein
LIQENERFLKERLPACCIAANKYIYQFFAIYDLLGESTSLMNSKLLDFLKLCSGFVQNYYPEILGMTYVINTNVFFRGVWNIIKGFFDERTVAKIQLKGEDYQKDLLTHV